MLRSFSKTVAPGIRLGIVTALPEIIAPMIKVKQAADLHSNIPLQAVLADVLLNPKFEQHLSSIVKIYGGRYRALSQMIKTHLSQCVFEQVEGGMFIWLQLPEDCNANKIAKAAIEQQNVAVVPGDVFFPEKKLSRRAIQTLSSSKF